MSLQGGASHQLFFFEPGVRHRPVHDHAYMALYTKTFLLPRTRYCSRRFFVSYLIVATGERGAFGAEEPNAGAMGWAGLGATNSRDFAGCCGPRKSMPFDDTRLTGEA